MTDKDWGAATVAYMVGVGHGKDMERADIVRWLRAKGYRQIADAVEKQEHLK
jgi:hypothetical protein